MFRVSKKLLNQKITIYQYEACPFCNKVKAYLEYRKIPYTTIEVNPFTKKELSFSKAYKKVPVAIIDGEQVNNSFDIIESIEQKTTNQTVTEATKKWNSFIDTKLAVTLLPNLYKSYGQAVEAFDYISRVPGWSFINRLWLKYFGAFFMWGMRNRLMRKYNLKAGDPRVSLYELIKEFETELGAKPFLEGDLMTTSDVIVFGGFRTVVRYQTGRDIFVFSPKTQEWYQRVEKAIQQQ
jgi:microsomal prostaglandin-E synthase 2